MKNQKSIIVLDSLAEFIGKNEKCFDFILEYLKKRNVIYKKTVS